MSAKKKNDPQEKQAGQHLQFLEALAKKLDGGIEIELDQENLIRLDWSERRLAAAALRYLALHTIEDEEKRPRGNPNFKAKFHHSWANTYYESLLKRGLKKTEAYKTITESINAELSKSDGVDEATVRLAIKTYRNKLTKSSGKDKK